MLVTRQAVRCMTEHRVNDINNSMSSGAVAVRLIVNKYTRGNECSYEECTRPEAAAMNKQ